MNSALIWIRSVLERVSRSDPNPPSAARRLMRRFGRLISGKGGSKSAGWEPAGLLASLRRGELKKTIEAEFETLLSNLADTRRFANYVVHGGALPGGETSRFCARQDGSVYFRFPDSSTRKKEIVTWEEFTYKDERDALKHLDELFGRVATFVGKMLDAFDALPLK